MGILSYIKKRLSSQEQIDDSNEKPIDCMNNNSNNHEVISLDITSNIEHVTEDQRFYEERFLEIKERAEKGEALFMTDLGLCYNQGWGTPIDKDKALYWTKKAAELKDPMGLHNLGVHYRDGDHVPKDFMKARECFLESSNLGLSRSSNDLGVMYYLGQGVEKNYEIAAKWYQKAIEQDNPYHLAFKNLAYLYKQGLGVEKNILESFRLLDEGGKIGSQTCIYLLSLELFETYVHGISYYYGLGGHEDKDKGLSLILTAFEYSYAPAVIWINTNKRGIINQYSSIDDMINEFPGLDYVDYVKMRVNNLSDFDERETIKGAARGEVDELCYLALMKLFMCSSAYENEDAIDLLTRSAQGGYNMALFWLGYCYEHGLEVKKDINEAKKYYLEVVNRGTTEGMWTINKLLFSPIFKNSDIDRGLAESHYRLASIAFYENNISEALNLLNVNYGNCSRHIPSVYLLGIMNLVAGNFEDALKQLSFCEANKSSDAAIILAKYSISVNDYSLFEKYCRNAIVYGSIPAVSLWLENKRD